MRDRLAWGGDWHACTEGVVVRNEAVWRLLATATAFGSVRPGTGMPRDELCQVGERLLGSKDAGYGDALVAELARAGIQVDATLSEDAVRSSLGIR